MGQLWCPGQHGRFLSPKSESSSIEHSRLKGGNPRIRGWEHPVFAHCSLLIILIANIGVSKRDGLAAHFVRNR